MSTRLKSSLAAAALVVALSAVIASLAGGAPFSDLRYSTCFAHSDRDGCQVVDPLRDVDKVVVSPDGHSVYATSYSGTAVVWFDRSDGGELTFAGCIANHGAHGCTPAGHDTLRNAYDIAISPDGQSVYVGTEEEGVGTLTNFDRASDGDLSFGSCLAVGKAYGCDRMPFKAIYETGGLAVSADGRFVYDLSGFRTHAIVSFARSDSGRLSFADCVSSSGQRGCHKAGVPIPELPFGLAVSPDGKSLFTGSFDDGFNQFDLGPSGRIHGGSCFSNSGRGRCTKPTHPSLEDAEAFAISPDSNSVYVISEDAVSRFEKDADGHLESRGCLAEDGRHDCRPAPHGALDSGSAGVVSPDGGSIYVVGLTGPSLNGGPGALSMLSRGPGGAISYVDCFESEGRHKCRKVPRFQLSSPEGVAISADGQSVYVASDETLAAFERK